MSRTYVEGTLTAAVAQNGTFTVAYPAGFTPGSFTAGRKHKLYALQTLFTAPDDFTVSLGASTVTVTYKGATTLPIQTDYLFEFDTAGADDYNDVPAELDNLEAAPGVELRLVDFGSPDTSDDDYFKASGSISASGSVTLLQNLMPDVVLLNEGYRGVARNIIITSDGNDSSTTYVVTGKDIYGETLVENLTGPNAGITAGAKTFAYVTSIAPAAAPVGLIKLGFGDVLGFPMYVAGEHQVVSEVHGETLRAREAYSKVRLQFSIADTALSAGTPTRLFSPVTGRITRLTIVTQTTILSAGTTTVEVDGSAVTGLLIAHASAGTVHEIQTDTPTNADTGAVTANSTKITITPSAAYGATGAFHGFLEIEPSKTVAGTLVAGVSATTPSATTGDVRGTYTPAVACDGTTRFAVLVASPNPNYKGATQYAG